MSFMLTEAAIVDRLKTVTRRRGWRDLQPGTLLRAVRKGQGLKKGEKVVPLAVIRVVSVRRESLRGMLDDQARTYTRDEARAEVAREGFIGCTPQFFAATLLEANPGTTIDTDFARIEFEYVDATPSNVGRAG